MIKTNQISLIKEKIEVQGILSEETTGDTQISKKLKHDLIKCMEQIKKYPNMRVDGNNIDSTISADIKRYTQSEELSQSDYKRLKKKHTITIDYLTGDIYSEIEVDRPTIIRQPNGKQQQPDILLLLHSRGIFIEMKSSKDDDKITWNGGFPRNNGVYIFNGTSTHITEDDRHTTFFMGNDLITKQEKNILLEGREQNKKNANDTTNQRLKLIESDWKLYPRAMFSYSGKFLSSPLRNQREQNVIEHVMKFNWKQNHTL